MHDERTTREEALKKLCEIAETGKSPEEVLPTLDDVSREVAVELGKLYEQRQQIRQRIIDGLSPRGRLRRNAACPCGSGKKFKKCCRRDYLDKINGKKDLETSPESETETTDEDQNQS